MRVQHTWYSTKPELSTGTAVERSLQQPCFAPQTMKPSRSLALVVILALASGNALVFPPTPVQHHVPAGIVRQHDTAGGGTPAATNKQHTVVAAAAAATEAGGRGGPAAGGNTAKERFLGNLERKRAGEDVRSSVLGADLSLLTTAVGRNQATDTRKPPSWRGKWEICYAPHIETLGKVILTKFGSVQYNFVSDDGRMVSHAGYDSAIFGSGWFNADGRVVLVPAADGMAGEDQQDVVKVSTRWRSMAPLHLLATQARELLISTAV